MKQLFSEESFSSTFNKQIKENFCYVIQLSVIGLAHLLTDSSEENGICKMVEPETFNPLCLTCERNKVNISTNICHLKIRWMFWRKWCMLKFFIDI